MLQAGEITLAAGTPGGGGRERDEGTQEVGGPLRPLRTPHLQTLVKLTSSSFCL